ncbi:hypothetical protein EX30DRAFT_36721 [Ascodesmis nigricans]|uniref:Uncharacterized protein n=1 Tax=Ascodesmis nigricans TaxID=341454 RepID=A0A4S2MWX8_9PEZI|nr:hypothetical protein EX30DRAFT_36721 [Ascodesmis nigricans]
MLVFFLFFPALYNSAPLFYSCCQGGSMGLNISLNGPHNPSNPGFLYHRTASSPIISPLVTKRCSLISCIYLVCFFYFYFFFFFLFLFFSTSFQHPHLLHYLILRFFFSLLVDGMVWYSMVWFGW